MSISSHEVHKFLPFRRIYQHRPIIREFGEEFGNSGDIIPIIVIDLPEIGIMSPDYKIQLLTPHNLSPRNARL